MNKPLCLVLGTLLLTWAITAHGQDTTKKYVRPTQQTAKPVVPVTKPGSPATNYGYKPAYNDQVQPVVVDNSLSGQYNAIIKATYHYQQGPVNTFYKSVMDTINLQKRKLKEANSKVAEQAKTIAGLQGDVNSKDQSLSESQSKVNSVNFLGIQMAKGTYNVIMWGLVLVLGGSLLAVIFLSASSRREAAYRIKLFDELSAEFQTYKIKANEKEKKLARELQTERNKLDELMNR